MELADQDSLSSFSFFDEKYENKIQDIWPMMESCLEEDYGISCALDLKNRCATVSTTTTSTKGATCFRLASNVIELLTATHVSPHLAIEILKGRRKHILIKIGYQEGGLCSKYGINKEQFDKQWDSLASMLPEVSAITSCKVYLNENTIAAVGGRSGVAMIEIFASNCFVHNHDLLDTLVSVRKWLFERHKHLFGEYVDYMRIENMDLSDMRELTSYSVHFNRSKGEAIQEAWPLAESLLDQYGISCTLNLAKGVLSVSTTRRTKDPFIIDKAEEFLDLLVNTSIPPTKAKEILNGRLQHEVIKTWIQKGGLCRTDETEKCMEEAWKNRGRLVRKEQKHAKYTGCLRRKAQEHRKNWGRLRSKVEELANLLKCEIYVDRCRVVAVSTSAEGVKLFRSIVEGCFLRNEDPAIVVKRLKIDHMVTDLMKKIQALCL